jgi:Mycobacterial 4 TMS phage holin, superfamily IV
MLRSAVVRLLISAVVWLGSATIGLLAAKLLLDGMTIDVGSFIVVVLIFAVLQAVLTPFLIKVTHRNAPALLSGVGLISTFLALLITTVVSSGMSITGLDTWVFATLIVWVVTMLATFLLPMLFAKKVVDRRRDPGPA